MRTGDDQAIQELLDDPGCPWSILFRGGDKRALSVQSFLRFCSARGLDIDSVEVAADDYVHRHGGRRQHLVSLWSSLPNLVRKFTRRSFEPNDIWLLPNA